MRVAVPYLPVAAVSMARAREDLTAELHRVWPMT